MYFSMFPLLLLFASTICASPVHIGRRTPETTLIGGVNLPQGRQGKALWYITKHHLGAPIQGVKGALKMKSGKKIIVKVDVEDEHVQRVMTMIETLEKGKQSLNWEWSIPSNGRVAFFIEMPPEGEDTVEKCLRTTDWPWRLTDKENNPTYEEWSSLAYKDDPTPIKGVKGCFLIVHKGFTLLRAVVPEAETAKVERAETMIADLGAEGKLVDWGWCSLLNLENRQVVVGFVVNMKPGWEEVVIKHL